MKTIRGIAVSHGIAIGPALVLDSSGVNVPLKHIAPAQIGPEIARLNEALTAASVEARQSRDRLASSLGTSYGAIFAAHAMLLDDPSFLERIHALIRQDLVTAETAVSRVMKATIRAIEGLGQGHFLATKTSDLYDIEKQIITRLVGRATSSLRDLTDAVIVLAHDLTPSQTAEMEAGHVLAFATESGGRTGHTAILAGALEIPAIVGLSRFLTEVQDGQTVIVDAGSGELIIDPTPDTILRYRERQSVEKSQAGVWIVQRDLPAETRDGVRIQLMGNIEFPSEAAHCTDRGADGVGLYRTEFLYTGRTSDPTEEEQYEAYSSVVRQMGPNVPVVIRTLDLGADKFTDLPWIGEPERNPFLGVRSIRLCLRNIPLFKRQMRAILRASMHGDVRIMFPMVSNISELKHCKLLLNDVKEDLHEEGIAFDRNMPVGTMIEVPSAALIAEHLAKEVDFFSIGTNDLIQYTLAADRNNEHVADLYTPADPSVLRLIRMVVEAAKPAGVDVNVCGEMSGDRLFTILLLGMGMRQLSVTPWNIPEIKRIIRLISMAEAEKVAREVLELASAIEVSNYLHGQLRRLLPEVAD